MSKIKAIPVGDDWYVGTEAGNVGDKLRYFVIVTSSDEIDEEKQNIFKISQSLTCKKFDSLIEKIEFSKNYIEFTVLIPMRFSVDDVIMNLIDICNSDEIFLREHYMCTNTTKPTKKEIGEYLEELKREYDKATVYKRKDIEITQKELESVLKDEWKFFKTKLLNNCLCHTCDSNGNSTIVDYKIYINYLNDTIFKGVCKKCKNPIGRYTETGEDEKISNRIDKLILSKGKKLSKWSEDKKKMLG